MKAPAQGAGPESLVCSSKKRLRKGEYKLEIGGQAKPGLRVPKGRDVTEAESSLEKDAVGDL